MRPLFTLLALSYALSAQAGLNKWVDENGKVHYSDTPPANVQTESVRSYTGKGQAEAPASYSSKSYAEREAELKKARNEKQEATAKSQQEAAAKAEKQRACTAARENLRTIESGTRLFTYDENGERRYVDDNEREQRLNSAREAAKANCD
ncbi:MAG: DUF4124 domain-containing protein [Pseudomonadota bacterium]